MWILSIRVDIYSPFVELCHYKETLLLCIFQLAGVGVLALSIWLLFDQAVVLMAKGAQDYATGTYILLAAGALMTIIGFLGCCGALRESQCLLGTVI